jgi:peptidoglycan/xylan/chitin deacetylase (PgdA/CDA1 family)
MTWFFKGSFLARILVVFLVVVSAFETIADSGSLPKPNEMGMMMILMYHDIGEKESTWSRKSEALREDLETLYAERYRPISLRELVNNNISTPVGFTPVVLTFDDGTKGQFRVQIKDGEKVIDPRSAVGILEAFHDEHPDFEPKATFFLHGNTPFFQPDLVEFKLRYLVDHGFDIGNHSTRHQNLGGTGMQSAVKIQYALGNQSIFLKKMLGNHPAYPIDTLALCYGARPKSAKLRSYLATGVSRGVPYRHIAIVNVGAGPSLTPGHKRFNPLSIPRIRASDQLPGGVRGLHHWLEYFRKRPQERYVSDGDQGTIAVPRSQRNALDMTQLELKRVITLD